eukprot:m.8583 g.8583  ORF g.8583 m.8583 type:complete len:699 (+) comp2308_c0_seq1:19-2115(+)
MILLRSCVLITLFLAATCAHVAGSSPEGVAALWVDANAACAASDFLKCYELFNRVSKLTTLVQADCNAAVALEKLGRTEEALARYEQAAKRFPGDQLPRTNAATLLGSLADVEYSQGKFAAALAYYRRLVNLIPENLDAHVNLANIQERMGALDDAIKTVQTIRRRDSDHLGSAHALCRLLLQKSAALADARARQAAETACRAAYELDEDSPVGRMNMGVLLGDSDPARAVEYLRGACAELADDAACWSFLAPALIKSNQIDEAIAIYRQAAVKQNTPAGWYAVGTAYVGAALAGQWRGADSRLKGMAMQTQAVRAKCGTLTLRMAWEGPAARAEYLHAATPHNGIGPVSVLNLTGAMTATMLFPDKHTLAVTVKGAYKQGLFGHVGAGCDVFAIYGSNTDLPRDFLGPDVPAVKLAERAIDATHVSIDNFSHMLLDVLPRLVMALEHFQSRFEDLPTVLLPPETVAPLFWKAIRAFQLDEQFTPIAYEPRAGARHDIDELYRIDFVTPPDVRTDKTHRNLWFDYFPSKMILHRVRDLVLARRRQLTTRYRVVYVSRTGVRSVDREDLLIAKLRAAFGKDFFALNLDAFPPGADPFLAQFDVFAHAEVILGPHGAGLSNIVACERPATVLEFSVQPYHNYAYAHHAGVYGLRYMLDDKISSSNFMGTYTMTDAHATELVGVVESILDLTESHAVVDEL